MGGLGNFDELVDMGYQFINVTADVVALWSNYLNISKELCGDKARDAKPAEAL